MTVILPHSRFLHVPKTGGSWVRQMLKRTGLHVISEESKLKHAWLERAPGKELYTFAFVRNPKDWWRSFWGYRMTTNWADKDTLIDKYCRDDDFNVFMDRVLAFLPGHCTTLFERYVGPKDNPIQFIGRTENIRDDLINALVLAGETGFREDLIRDFPPLNDTDFSVYPANYSPEQLRALGEAERETFERFGYSLD